MTDSYRPRAKAELALNASQINGLPSNISLNFNKMYIKFYKTEHNYFSCSVSFPKKKDDQGFPLELDFSCFRHSSEEEYNVDLVSNESDHDATFQDDTDPVDNEGKDDVDPMSFDGVYDSPLRDYTDDERLETGDIDLMSSNNVYDAPLQDHTYDTLASAVSCHFKAYCTQGKWDITLVLRVSGTAFYGWVMIDSELYSVN